MAQFIPRQVFPHYGAIPRSYFLGHHRAGLSKMKNMLSTIDYVVECRDYRAPVTSINPLFEEALGNKRRLVVYTKRDLGSIPQSPTQRLIEKKLRSFDPNSAVFFVSSSSRADVTQIIRHLRDDAEAPDKLVGCRVLVVGMPNIGKSTLINHLRNFGVGKAKALKTGGQPGITRKIASPVKIIERESGSHVYVLDTPGVFMPYVPDADNMLKLALCGCVKDAVISPVTLVDYLLYQINLHDAQAYKRWSEPTNEVMPLLESFARQTGLLGKGGIPIIDSAALHFIQKWRAGDLGRFILDDLDAEQRRRDDPEQTVRSSMSQALKVERTSRKNKPDVITSKSA
ncbi:Mitochondrial GTPase 1 [Penicillium rolfsii]|nr:Mitochondrial GTPase 1 [Penicillium rolfsii]